MRDCAGTVYYCVFILCVAPLPDLRRENRLIFCGNNHSDVDAALTLTRRPAVSGVNVTTGARQQTRGTRGRSQTRGIGAAGGEPAAAGGTRGNPKFKNMRRRSGTGQAPASDAALFPNFERRGVGGAGGKGAAGTGAGAEGPSGGAQVAVGGHLGSREVADDEDADHAPPASCSRPCWRSGPTS